MGILNFFLYWSIVDCSDCAVAPPTSSFYSILLFFCISFSIPFSSFHPYHNQGSELIWKKMLPQLENPWQRPYALMDFPSTPTISDILCSLIHLYSTTHVLYYINFVILMFVTVVVNCCWMLKLKDPWFQLYFCFSRTTVLLFFSYTDN